MTFRTFNEPPRELMGPYLIPALAGESIYIPTSKSVMRLLVTGHSSANAFAIVATNGGADKPIRFHFRNDAHDVFLCLKGRVAVWAETQDGEGIRESRVLEPGDFASVPPRTIHQYQVLADHSDFMGLIVPGGWEEFFRTIGDPYQGPLFPPTDDRPFHTALLPRLKQAAEEHDMIRCPTHETWSPTRWADQNSQSQGNGTSVSSAEVLPGALRPYFLRASSGPKWRADGSLIRRMCGIQESNDRFTVAEWQGLQGPADLPSIRFEKDHHCFFVTEGSLRIDLGTPAAEGGEKTMLRTGETAFIPAGQAFGVQWLTRWESAYIFCSERGYPGVLEEIGEPWDHAVIDRLGPAISVDGVKGLAQSLAFSLV